ncbi:MAG: hypothetical protein ABJQ29_09070 [Luteolibacter sp.]
MGFHYEEECVADGIIDNRIKGRTILKINFTNRTSSLITLQGNPCRDLAGSLWRFRNPHARMDEIPGEPCFFIPALCEGIIGRVSYTKKREVPILPPDEHYERLFDDDQEDPPTRIAPVLELEWFSQKYQQVEIDCELMTLELVELCWALSAQEAAEGEAVVEQTREQFQRGAEDSMAGFYEDMELIDEYVADDPDPHELEEACFLIVQEFVINSADGSDEKQELHSNLLKLQEQIALTFTYLDHDGNFTDIPATIRLLHAVIPFIDRAVSSAKYVAETTAELLLELREGIIALSNQLAASKQS